MSGKHEVASTSTGHLVANVQEAVDRRVSSTDRAQRLTGVTATTEEPRRSGRATKGQHKHTSSSPAPVPKPTKQAARKPAKKTKASEANKNDNNEDNDDVEEVIRCICGNTDPSDKRAFIGCDACLVWQHNVCMGITDDEEDVPEHYFCEECRPEEHQEALQALAAGEKIWETRNKIYQNEKKSKGRKSRGKASGDIMPGWLKKDVPPVEASSEAQAPLAEDVNQELGSKRKREDADEEIAEARTDQQEEKSTTRAGRLDKRRKSSTVDATATPAAIETLTETGKETNAAKDPDTALVGLEELPQDRQKVAMVLSKIITDNVDERAKAGFSIAQDETPKSLGEHHALRIEYALHMNHGSPKEAAYATQFRALNANMKKNNVLIERLINGSLTADELSTMNSSDMASEELQKERAIMKEALDRQAIAIPEEGPRYRQDHKGYRLIEDENQHLADNPMPRPGTTAVAATDDKVATDDADSQPKPTSTGSPAQAQSAPLSLDTRKSSRSGIDRRSSSQQFDMSNIWAKAAHSPTSATPPRPMQATDRRQSASQPAVGQQNGAKHDPDIDRMLEDNDDTDSPADFTGSDAIVWRGKLVQANDENSPTVNARFVAGRDLAPTVPWQSLLPEVLSIDGRLQIQKAEDYLCGLRWSNSSDVSVLALSPYDNADAFNATFNYFSTRQRYAVVEKGKPPIIKDLYIIPVEAGAKLPEHVDMLLHCTLKNPAEERLLLATLVVARGPISPPARVDGTPSQQPAGNLPHHVRQSISGPAGSPLTSQTPAFSPRDSAAPPPSYGGPGAMPPNPYAPHASPHVPAYPARQPHPNPHVNAILGDLQYEPTAQQVLAADPNLDETRLQNLRAVLIDDPNARTDLNVLSDRLFAPR